MTDRRSYISPIPLGGIIRAYAGGEVVESRHHAFPVGTSVTGVFGVQTYAISRGEGVETVDTKFAPMERWIGGLGMPGLTAYFGLYEVGQVKPSDTVVVSGAAGAVGSIAGQLARNMGCRVVGIAGGSEKCRHVKNKLGFDACLDHRLELKPQLKAACPHGIDLYFDNVGGPIQELMLSRMNTFGRISVCGLISQYNAKTLPPGPRTFSAILTKRLTVRGFIVFDFRERYGEALRILSAQYEAGLLTMVEDVREKPIDDFPGLLAHLFTGAKLGKLALRIVH